MSLPQYHMQRLASSKSCFIAETLLNPDDTSCLTCPNTTSCFNRKYVNTGKKTSDIKQFHVVFTFFEPGTPPMLKTYSNMLA